MRETLISFIDDHLEEQFSFLRKLVLQPSHTSDKAGVDLVGKAIIEELADCNMLLEVVEGGKFGNNLIFRSQATKFLKNPLLLVGHMDTVFPPGSTFNTYWDNEQKAFGPGIIDMKGGLVTAISALKALNHLNMLEQIPLTLVCNSDEETGSLNSKDLISREAKRSSLALVFECGGLNGEIVTGRKGKTGYTLNVTGKAGHAAFAGRSKASAILGLAKKIVELEQLNDPKREMVINVGIISGGTGPNTVPENAIAQIDTRYLRLEDGKLFSALIEDIVERCTIPDTHGEITITSNREPMEQTSLNRSLFHHIASEATQLAIPIREELRSGVSDANTIAGVGTPVVDGLGPVGDCDHSDQEYMVKDSLVERTKLAAVSIASGWNKLQNGDLQFH